jgi:hypothetical protein
MSQQTEASRDRLTIAFLNTRGIPVLGSHLAERYGAIAGAFVDQAYAVVSLRKLPALGGRASWWVGDPVADSRDRI